MSNYKKPYFQTCVASITFISLGISLSIVGPTLPSLLFRINETISSTSYLVPCRSIGYMIGSLIGGYLYEKFQGALLVFIALLITAIGNLLIPFVKTSLLLASIFLVVGIVLGILEIAGNVYILELWEKNSEPWLQLVHFMFAFGGTFTPLIASPFLKSTTINCSTEVCFENQTVSLMKESSSNSSNSFPTVAWVYIICFIFIFINSLMFLYIWITSKQQMKKNEENKEVENDVETEFAFRIKMLVFLFIFYFLYVGLEVGFGTYIYIFATTCSNPLNKTLGSLLTTIFWAFLSIGNFVSIFISIVLSAKNMLTVLLFSTVLANAILVMYPLYAYSFQSLLWVGVALLGLSCSSIFPTGISWSDQYIKVNSRVTSVMVIGGSIGEIALTFFMASVIELNPMNMIYISAACGGLMFITFILAYLFAEKHGKRKHIKSNGSKDENVETLMLSD